jgi:hypothetical protein
MSSSLGNRFSRFAMVTVASVIAALGVVPSEGAAAEPSTTPAPPILNAFDAFAPQGPLVSSSARALLVSLPGRRVLRVHVTPSTVYCRAALGCSARRTDLHRGDIVSALMRGTRARRIDANAVATDVEIDAVSGNALTVHGVRAPDASNPPYTLVVGPSTITQLPGGNHQTIGALPGAHVGQRLYYTGLSATPVVQGLPEAATQVYAARIFPSP